MRRRIRGLCATAGMTALGMLIEPHGSLAQESTRDWSGFYLGAHGGYGWSTIPVDGFDDLKLKGAIGGLHAGYQWQWSKFVLGLELDATATGVKHREATYQSYKETHFEIDSRWLASARARLGYDLGPAMLYATGGVAFNDWSFKTTEIEYGLGTDETTGGSRRFGWVIGGGGEFKLTNSLILRIEGLHYSFKDMPTDMKLNGMSVANSGLNTIDQNITVVRSGLSWRF